MLADAAISAMRTQDDPTYIEPVLETLRQHETNFTSRGFAADLDALAYLSRNEKEKDSVRNFLLSHVHHKKKTIQVGAIAALGTLEDSRAAAVVATFAAMAKETPERKAAEKSLAAIRAANRQTDNLKNLRDEILDLKKESRETKKELEALGKKLESKTPKPASKSVRSPRDN